jgi:ComF family protein
MSLAYFAKNFVLDILFPIQCLGCGIEFEKLEPEKRWICKSCLDEIETIKDQVCPVCEKLSDGGKTHHSCQKETSLNGLWVATKYDYKIVREAIRKLKFNFIKDISFPLSEIIAKSVLEVGEFGDFHDLLMVNFSQENGEEKIYVEKEKNKKAETVLVPVPLHKRRYNWRGFNQSFLLSKYIAQKFNLTVSERAVVRKRNTAPQAKVKFMEERKKNVEGAFHFQDKKLVENKNIIVVDDVCTTLSTLNECAKELKKAGAKNVWGLVVARR